MNFGVGEFEVWSGDDEVAGGEQAGAAAHRGAVGGGYRDEGDVAIVRYILWSPTAEPWAFVASVASWRSSPA